MNENDPRFGNRHDEPRQHAGTDPASGTDEDAAKAPPRRDDAEEKGERMSFADWLRVQRKAHLAFGDRLRLVRDWSAPTPDEEWNVSELVRHVVEEQQWVPLLLDGRTIGEARSRLEPLRDDLLSEWERHSPAAMQAWASVSPDARVHLSYDTVPASAYLREQVSDVIVHTWDLARAVGADESLDDDLVEAAWTVFEPQKDTLQASGLFASPVPIPEDAPLQSRLLALTGRDDRVAA